MLTKFKRIKEISLKRKAYLLRTYEELAAYPVDLAEWLAEGTTTAERKYLYELDEEDRAENGDGGQLMEIIEDLENSGRVQRFKRNTKANAWEIERI
mgnify:FL=1